ncbi:hypothetical protein MNBD_BACTEROID02-1395 [hydrothermal vent metagenome]|uniref:Secretion system C-terminal sorting domain-containing protein n=1 Tax=hydrothermal vent metagenome TaxID=652676 RepID=A0A3B0QWQ6_9ZZZZ
MKKTLFYFTLFYGMVLSAQTPIFNSGMTITGEGSISSPVSEGVDKIIDGNTNTKFLDFNFSDGMGFTVNLGGASSTATSIEITTSNDVPNRDAQNYEVLGSNDGTSFTSIVSGTIPCVATRFFARTFTFANTVSYGYYRIIFTTQCGSDNSLQFAEVQLFENALGITENKLLEQNINVLPNPNKGSFYLKYNGNSKLNQAILIDVTGKKIQSIDLKQFNNQQKFEISNIVSGIYFLNIITPKAVVTKKIIIQ